jgi:hypothetical protein
MMSELFDQADGYLIGRVSLEDFDRWFAANLNRILHSGDARAVALADSIQAELLALAEDEINAEDFDKRFSGHLARVGTVICDPEYVTSDDQITVYL